MDYVKIPQNIRVEDKLIGPLSLRQIIIIALGGGASYALFAMVSKSMGSVPPAAHAVIWIPLALCAAFALVKINDIPLTRYSLLTFELMVKPRRRVWQPRRGINALPHGIVLKKSKDEEKKVTDEPEKKSAVRLADLSTLLDRDRPSFAEASTTVTAPIENVSDADILLDAHDQEAASHADRLDAIWKEMKKTSTAVS